MLREIDKSEGSVFWRAHRLAPSSSLSPWFQGDLFHPQWPLKSATGKSSPMPWLQLVLPTARCTNALLLLHKDDLTQCQQASPKLHTAFRLSNKQLSPLPGSLQKPSQAAAWDGFCLSRGHANQPSQLQRRTHAEQTISRSTSDQGRM